MQAMKQLVRKPFLLALILSLPLWVALNNYIVAICVALLVAFLVSMLHSIFILRRVSQRTAKQLSRAAQTKHDPPNDTHV